MNALVSLVLLMLKRERAAFFKGALLSLVVLLMGAALLALSGWFITAAAAAGLVGMGILFNVFAPSAMVRFLALGRTAARYGERLTTHDATLRALSDLRMTLLGGVLCAPFRQLERLRAGFFLNRVTADIDALDGMALRLVLPALAGLSTIALVSVAVALLVHPTLGGILFMGYAISSSAIFFVGQRAAARPARRAQTGIQALRSRMIDLVALREELVAFGKMPEARQGAARAAGYWADAQTKLEHVERRMGLGLDLAGWAVVAACLGLGGALAEAGAISAAQAAIAIFAALALSEAVAPVRRALAEIGQMRLAAQRIAPMLDAGETARRDAKMAGAPDLKVEGLKMCAGARALFGPICFEALPGQTIALVGPSGCGKSTVLLAIAGQLAPSAGRILIGGAAPSEIEAGALMRQVAMVPQRHALVAGTIGENLRLAAPDAEDGALWAALEAVCLAQVIEERGGLEAQLGFRGAGLSGGEARRLVLARALLRRPDVLLLDEPTEGLDGAMAEAVLSGLRRSLPDAAFIMAAHRKEELSLIHI